MITIIVAIARNGIIGAGGTMPWHIAEDLRMFRRTTTGHAVVMGRRTFDSLGRPLPGRTNVVVTRDRGFSVPGVTVFHSLTDALAAFPDCFVIGGADIYRQALPLANRLMITAIDADFEGDTSFPEWSRDEWEMIACESFPCGENFPSPFAFQVWERRSVIS